MGSTFSIVLYGRDGPRLEAAAQAAFDEVRRLEGMLSTRRPGSECGLVNRRAAHRPVLVSPEFFRLVSFCLDHSRATDGAFDITVGPLKRAWGFAGGTGSVPSADALAAARRHVGHRLVRLDAGAQTVQFDHSGVEIDLGGVGKGYAVDRVTDILRRHGVDTALVAGSASSLYGLGAPPAEPRGWRADIRDSAHRGTRVAQVFLRDASLTTSGTGEKCFWSDGTMYSHILDPRTGWPLQSPAQISVVAPRAVDGEVWAKACLLNGIGWAAGRTPDAVKVLACCLGGNRVVPRDEALASGSQRGRPLCSGVANATK
jgi:thiamine biosynthesis lipoprotein